MIQFNLLPDVKLEYIRTTYRKHLILTVSAIAASAALAVFVLLFLYVRVNQTHHIRALDKDISKNVEELKSTKDLDKILTVQNQLNSLTELHDKKVIGSRLVDYLVQLTPEQATISDVDINFEDNTMKLEGNADTLSTVNKYIDTMKFTRHQVNKVKKDQDTEDSLKEACVILPEDTSKCRAFKEVVFESFEIEKQENSVTKNGGPIKYVLTLKFDPVIFSNVKDAQKDQAPVVLAVPKGISTRSVVETPGNNLFAPQAKPSQNDQGDPR